MTEPIYANLNAAIAALETIAEMLNHAIVATAGDAADWRAQYPAEGLNQDSYAITQEQLHTIAIAREEANSILFWLGENLPNRRSMT